MKKEDNIEIRESVWWFAVQMEKKLRENDYKGGWEDCSMQYLTDRISEEIVELGRAIKEKDQEVTIKECADIANFTMMIADLNKRYDVDELYED